MKTTQRGKRLVGAPLLTATDRTDSGLRPLDRTARASVIALARSLEVFDPAAARRAADRAHLVDRIAVAAGSPTQDRVDAITASILAEIGILLTHARPVETVAVIPNSASAVLSARMLDRLPGLGGTAGAVRHQFERWDGTGGPDGRRGADIPLAARLLAVAATLVGPPGPKNGTARLRLGDELLGTALDPDLGGACADWFASGDPTRTEVELDEILAGLDRFVPPERDSPLEALVSIGAAGPAADRLTDILLGIAEQALRALHADTITIDRLDCHEMRSKILVSAGTSVGQGQSPAATEFHTKKDQPGLAQLLSGEGLLRAVDEGPGPDEDPASLHRRGLRSEAAWPIIIGDAVWGAVWATRTTAAASILNRDDLSTLRLVASHVAAAVTQEQRIAEFELLALRDPLTGLANRRVLEESLARIFRRNPADRQDVALVMCDIDGLKLINDDLGHAAGDQLLVEAARALRAAADTVASSTVCRIGGDEFCVILDGGGMEAAEPVTALALRLFSESGPERSLSCGIAFATPDLTSPGDLLRAADEAQYEKKRQRRLLPRAPEIPSVTERRRSRRDT